MHKKNIKDKIKKLREIIGKERSVVVAFSGGVDSSVVAKISYDELRNRAVAVTINSEIFPKRDLEISKKIAEEIGVEHIIVEHSDLNDEKFVENPVDRCYFCKSKEIKMINDIAKKKGINSIAFGVTISDFGEYRPGMIALNEDKSSLPLVEAGIGKESIGDIAKELGLSNFALPSTTCLASRIPYGERITYDKLKRIEKAEIFLLELGFSQVRVRNHMNLARIEVEEEEMGKLFLWKDKIVSELKRIGFVYVSLDLSGYRSGSMNETLKK